MSEKELDTIKDINLKIMELDEQSSQTKKTSNPDMYKNHTITALNAQYASTAGKAASQYVQAYNGVRYDMSGNRLDFKGRSLKEISNYKVNPDFKEANIRQHAGFDAELIKEARDNSNAILKGESTRTRTTDGQGQTNNQLHDHVKVDANGNEIPNSGSQMKFLKNPEKTVDNMVKNKNWEKYSDSPMDVPSDQYQTAVDYCTTKAESLRRQAQACAEKGNTAKAKQLNELANKYDKAKGNLRDSGVTTKEAIQATEAPAKFVTKELVKGSAKAGAQAALVAGAINLVIDGGKNAYAVYCGDKDVKEALVDVSKSTLKVAANGFVTVGGGTFIGGIMQGSEKALISKMGYALDGQLPILLVTAAVDVTGIMIRYAKGEIDIQQVGIEIGASAVGLVGYVAGAALGAAIGTVICPGAGTKAGEFVGGMIGSFLSKFIYDGAIKALKDYKISRERRIMLEEFAEQAHQQMIEQQNYLTTLYQQMHTEREIKFESFIKAVDESIMLDKIDDFFDAVQDLGQFFNKDFSFKTFEEFDEFMSNKNTELVL